MKDSVLIVTPASATGTPPEPQPNGNQPAPRPPRTLEDKILRRLPMWPWLDQVDLRITTWMARYGLLLMRIALGIIFFWFGALKLVPGLSPAEDLVRSTIFFINPDLFQPVLAVWEMAIGIGLITGQFMRLTLLLLFLQMPGTMLPLVLQPQAVFT
ncbi:MAG: DoxX family membrane protein, partial [Caldilineaceae bacterium]